jgi:hypothetical protein
MSNVILYADAVDVSSVSAATASVVAQSTHHSPSARHHSASQLYSQKPEAFLDCLERGSPEIALYKRFI